MHWYSWVRPTSFGRWLAFPSSINQFASVWIWSCEIRLIKWPWLSTLFSLVLRQSVQLCGLDPFDHQGINLISLIFVYDFSLISQCSSYLKPSDLLESAVSSSKSNFLYNEWMGINSFLWLQMVLYITATHVFFDACKVSYKPCQFTKLNPVLRIMNWVSENQVVLKCFVESNLWQGWHVLI